MSKQTKKSNVRPSSAAASQRMLYPEAHASILKVHLLSYTTIYLHINLKAGFIIHTNYQTKKKKKYWEAFTEVTKPPLTFFRQQISEVYNLWDNQKSKMQIVLRPGLHM